MLISDRAHLITQFQIA